jgi:hypothetical protein
MQQASYHIARTFGSSFNHTDIEQPVPYTHGIRSWLIETRIIRVREDIVVMSWQEHIGSTIVHVLDFANDRTHTYVTPEKGGFLQLSGTLRSRSVEMA